MMLERQRTNRHLNRAGGAKGVTMHRLGRTDGNRVRLSPEDLFDSERFRVIIERRGTAMGVNIADLLRHDLGFLQSQMHRPCGWLASRMWGSHVVSVIGEAIAEDFTDNSGAAIYSVLEFLKHKHRRSFCHHKAITRTIKRPIRQGRDVVGGRHGMNDIESAK